MKATFHRDGRVTVQGVTVGTYRSPDPSGAVWANSRRWIFSAVGGATQQAARRDCLSHHAVAAYRRLTTTSAQAGA